MDFPNALQIFISGANLGAIYTALGLGFFVIYSVTRLVNLAQGEFVMLGGMLTVSFYKMGIPLVPSITLAVIISGLAGAGLYRFIIYPARGYSRLTQLLLTVGFVFAIQGVALLIWGWDFRSLPAFFNTPCIQLWGATIFGQTPWVIGVTLVMVIGLFFFFGRTIQGKALRACANEPLGARTMGVNIDRMALYSFIMAAGLGAVVGAMITPLTMTSYSMGWSLTIKGVLAAFVGGINRAEGVILGGVALGMMEAAAAGMVPGGYHNVIAPGILIAVLLLRPHGILAIPGRVE